MFIQYRVIEFRYLQRLTLTDLTSSDSCYISNQRPDTHKQKYQIIHFIYNSILP